MYKSLFQIPANAIFTRVLLSSHKTATSALAKAKKLQAEAPEGVGYEVIGAEDLYVKPFQVYRITIVRVEAPAAPVAAKPRFQVNQLGFRYYAVRDTKVGRNVQTMCGTPDAEARANAAAAELNAAN